MARRWTAWKLAISAFVLFHMAGTLAWVMPASPMRQAMVPWFSAYMIPLGLWQAWGMFAPDPLQSMITLEAEVSDARGHGRIHEFTKVADLPWWRKLPKFRHPKFAANLGLDEYAPQREMAARHVVRTLGIAPEAFPVYVRLYYQVAQSPPLGSSQADPMVPKTIENLAAFQFDTWDEVHRR
ncbi:hypothetical protein [Paludisphaera mucosa]|uniref:Uncharacterized protein n=1 Tax=Paludisphaera mucosa TaxID=3030827 RepID=A0ABT6FBD3_9BACT|nr:hypothetical protein [Paludisphaera mucosa]MDG3004811.1 hypothetical protein [Paludisphaera mucosa]